MKQCKVLEVNVDDMGNGGVFSLIKSVVQHCDSQIKIDIAALEKFEKKENIDEFHKYHCEVKYIGYEGNKLLKQVYIYNNLLHLLRQEHYDIVHIHADVANKLLVSGLAAKHAGVKNIILHSHAAGVDGAHRKMKTFVHKLCRRPLKWIGTTFVSCSHVAAVWMFPNIKKSDIIFIHNGVDCDKFKFDERARELYRSELKVKDEILVGHVGRFSYQKNHDYILKIAARMKQRGIKAKFLLVGEGPDQKDVMRLAQESGLEDWIIFNGLSDHVNELYSAMDVFILPSHFEGLPIVGVEAQVSGLPCIFSDQVTREVKLTKNVKFLGIKDDDIDQWADTIESCTYIKRRDASEELKREKYDIQDTVRSFMKLYQTKA